MSKFYVWDEATAGRGSVEIVACIRKWLDVEYSAGDFEKLIVFSDNCGGQNKNINMVLNYLNELHSARLTDITHYYLVPGHSYMACDRAFGNIEKAVRRHGDIHNMDTYFDIIKHAVHAGYEVNKMQRNEFLDVGQLIKYVVHRKPRPPYSFSKTRRLVFHLNFMEGYYLGMGYTSSLGSVRLMPGKAEYRRSKFRLSDVVLPQKYSKPPQLKMLKIKDMEDLIAFIPSASATYLRGVLDEQHALRQDTGERQAPPASDNDDDPDNPDRFMDYQSPSTSDSDSD